MALVLLLHLVAGALIFGVGRRLAPRGVMAVAAVGPAVALVALVLRVPEVRDGAEPSWSHRWVEGLDLGFSFRLDGFSLLMGLIVTGVGVLVLAYSAAYFGPDADRARMARFGAAFTLFAGAMLGLVLADDVWTLFVFWELTSITSFALIGLDDTDPDARTSAQRALLVTAAGGLALMGGLALVTSQTDGTTFAALSRAPIDSTIVQVGLACALVGAFTKSAQVPFQFWLPGAMAAPTPVSAYLHSATMVKAGIILVGRLAPAFAEVTWWRPALVAVGGTTMLLGGIAALRQVDAKLLLAKGTVSQLGFLMLVLGIGHPATTAAGVAVLVGHALFKAPLFLLVGVVDHAAGTRDLRRLSGVGRALPFVAGLTTVAAASMAGLPPLLGFAAKEAALDALLEHHDASSRAALVAVVAGSVLTVAYTLRLWLGTFTDAGLDTDAGEPATVHHRPSIGLLAPIVVLVGATLAGGLLAGPLGEELGRASEALDHDAHGHLTLWAGVKPALLLSILIVALGVVLHLVLGRGVRIPSTGVSGTVAFQRGFDGLLDGARRLTGIVQNGSLPAYVAVTFTVLVAGLGAAAVGGARLGDAPRAEDSLLQVAIVVFAAAMAGAMVTSQRRFVSVLMLGVIGYCLAGLFLLAGAPDLALTQVLVETVSLVVFLLVLRHLPEDHAPPPEWAPRAVRLTIAIAVGVAVAGFAMTATSVRTERPVAEEMIERSEPDGGGRNVVNVVLIDIRGIDTMGEITVLAIAAAGIANLVRRARRRPDDDGDPLSGEEREPLAPLPLSRLGPGSVVFDQVTRLAFPLIMVMSVYVMARGHNAPGGGFAGGLIAGSGFAMRHLAGGSPPLVRPRRLPTTGLIGSGLLLAVLTGFAALLGGEDFLTSSILKLHPPLVGTVKLVSSAVFDLGVYLLVLGVVLSVLAHLGADTPVAAPAAEDRP